MTKLVVVKEGAPYNPTNPEDIITTMNLDGLDERSAEFLIEHLDKTIMQPYDAYLIKTA